MPLAAFDIESTSADPFTARIVTACVVRVNGGDTQVRNWIADPGVPIPAEASEIHGISTEYAQKHGRPHDQVVAEVVTELQACWAEGRAVAIYNATYDLSLLATQSPTFRLGAGVVIDPFVLHKRFGRQLTGSGRRKLGAVCDLYGIRLDAAHNADADALAAARLAWKLGRLYPDLAALTAPEVMAAQADWYREDAHQIKAALRHRQRPHDQVRATWPIQRATESAPA